MADEIIRFHYDVDGDDFSSAGAASVDVKKQLRKLGFSPDVIRRVAIAMYEGEINMVIHADGGTEHVCICVIRAEACHYLKGRVCIGALMRATDDNVEVFTCQMCEVLIEIKVVAGQKAETDTLHLDNGGLGKFKTVVAVQLKLGHFAGG
jgi:hypothetical protein